MAYDSSSDDYSSTSSDREWSSYGTHSVPGTDAATQIIESYLASHDPNELSATTAQIDTFAVQSYEGCEIAANAVVAMAVGIPDYSGTMVAGMLGPEAVPFGVIVDVGLETFQASPALQEITTIGLTEFCDTIMSQAEYQQRESQQRESQPQLREPRWR